MHAKPYFIASACFGVFLGVAVHAAAITGSVKGPDGAAFKAAFVKAQNVATRVTVAVLSDDAGRYRIDALPAGEYRISFSAVGFRADSGSAVTLKGNKSKSVDVALQKDVVRWTDMSLYQAKELFPFLNGRELFFDNCTSCHAFQTKIATASHDAAGWKQRVEYERATHRDVLGHLTSQDVVQLSYYLSRLFGPEAELEKSPADKRGQDMHPGYSDTVRSFSGDSLNIVYVEYDVPAPGRYPLAAMPDAKGNIWIPNGGAANKITQLQPLDGALQDFSIPGAGPANIQTLLPAPDGSIWLAAAGPTQLSRLNPDSRKVVAYPDDSSKGSAAHRAVRLDSSGNVWTSGAPLTRFDPKTDKFARIEAAPASYDVQLDKQGNAWFSDPAANQIGKVDGKTLSVTQWELPSPDAGPRNLQVGPDGTIWIAAFTADKLVSFDPAAQTFNEHALPGPEASPAALAFDADGYLWYCSYNTDAIVRFDTRNGKAIRYPAPHADFGAQEFLRDSSGRIWFGSAANGAVGYFFVAGSRQ